MNSAMHRVKRSAAILTAVSCFLNLYVIAVWIYAYNAEGNYRASEHLFRSLIPVNYQNLVLFLSLLIFLSFIYLVRWIDQNRVIKMLLVFFQSLALSLLVFSFL